MTSLMLFARIDVLRYELERFIRLGSMSGCYQASPLISDSQRGSRVRDSRGRSAVKDFRIPRAWIDLAIAIAFGEHLYLYAVTSGAELLRSFPTSDPRLAVTGTIFLLGLISAPYLVLLCGRGYASCFSRSVILLSAGALFIFDGWRYASLGDDPVGKQWYVLLGPVMFLLPASLISLFLAYVGRNGTPRSPRR